MRSLRSIALATGLVLSIAVGGTASQAADWRIDPAAVAARIRAHLPDAARDRLDQAVEQQASAGELARALLGTRDLERMLLDAAAKGGIAPAPVAAPAAETSLVRAGTNLIAASGGRLDEASLAGLQALAASLPAVLEGPIARLASAMIVAAEARAAALAPLSAAERAVLERIAARPALLDSPRTRAEFDRLSQNVDLARMLGGAALVLRTAQAILPALRDNAALLRPSVLDDPEPLNPEACAATDLALPIGIGGVGPDCWANNHILSIDLGGNDTYRNNAGGTYTVPTPGPIAVLIDITGDDKYHSAGAGGAAQAEAVVEGAGVGGIGILLDVVGNDSYNSNEVLASPGPVSYSADVTQGAGVAGIGVLADILGSDDYNSNNTLTSSPPNGGTTVSYVVQRSQGAGVGGIGLMADVGLEADDYNSNNLLTGGGTSPIAAATYLVSDSQGAGEGLPGVGVHVDTGGDDRYNSFNVLGPPPGSTAPPPLSAGYTVRCSQGIAGSCDAQRGGVALALGALVNGLGTDNYNSQNQLNARTTTYLVTVAQGADSGALGAGIMVEGPGIPAVTPAVIAGLGGVDRYNSANVLKGTFVSSFQVQTVQGAGLAAGGVSPAGFGAPSVGVGVLLDAGLTEDYYNALNDIGVSTLAIECAQGCGVATATSGFAGVALGVHADISLKSTGDQYNSSNTQSQAPATITRTLGTGTVTGGAPLGGVAAGVMLDLDLGDFDHFNSANTNIATTIAQAEGAGSGSLGVGAFVDTAGSNVYNAFNTGPTVRSGVIASGVAPLGIGAFVDLLGVDIYGVPAGAPSFCAGPAVLIQLDGLINNVPASVGPPCILDLDI
jgi:hypothetical protein